KSLFFFGLKGMGIGNWETPEISGERDFILSFVEKFNAPVVIDVGANIGNYSIMLKSASSTTKIFAFEPHPTTFKKLEMSAEKYDFTAINAACGSEISVGTLYDHGNANLETGTEHASLVKNVIEEVHSVDAKTWSVNITTIDSFVKKEEITRINLLKIDVEGGEMNVLLGAIESIKDQLIDLIHFEFTEANTVSRVFMKDFYELLADFTFYRMLSDGLAPLGQYYSLSAEIFGYQNIIAVRKELDFEFH
ncbi:MAG: FkbM family methyltransferase, partial [Pyrinomonadaceae bacterium]